MRVRTRWQWTEAGFSLLVIAMLAVALAVSLGFGQRAGLFAWVVITPTLALALWQGVDDLRGRTAPPSSDLRTHAPQGVPDAPPGQQSEGTRRELAVVGWIVVLAIAIVLLGFPIGGALFTFAILSLGSREPAWVSIPYAVCVYLILEIMFRQLLLIPFPAGQLFEWIGFEPRINLRLLFPG